MASLKVWKLNLRCQGTTSNVLIFAEDIKWARTLSIKEFEKCDKQEFQFYCGQGLEGLPDMNEDTKEAWEIFKNHQKCPSIFNSSVYASTFKEFLQNVMTKYFNSPFTPEELLKVDGLLHKIYQQYAEKIDTMVVERTSRTKDFVIKLDAWLHASVGGAWLHTSFGLASINNQVLEEGKIPTFNYEV